MRPHVLQNLFEPRSVALVCEDLRPGSTAALLVQHMRSGSFSGELLVVSTRPAQDSDVPHYPDFASVARVVDLTVMVLPTAQVPAQLRACAEQGCRAVILIPADGGEREQRRPGLTSEILDIAGTYDMALLGPDSLGVTRPRVGLNLMASPNRVRSGSVALLAQSAGFANALLDWAESNQFGFSLVAAPGATHGVNMGDLLDYLSVDGQTRSVLVYLENIADSRTFLSGLRTAARVKPVLVLRSGRSAAGERAETMADRVFDAAVARAGAVRVNTVHQLFTGARALMAGTRVGGNRLAIVTNAAGPARMTQDRAARRGVALPDPSDRSDAIIRERVPGARRVGSALDLLGDAGPEAYREATATLLADENFDAVLALLTPQRVTDPTACAQALLEAAKDARKPVLACWMGQDRVAEARALLAGANVLQFTSPERCLDAFSYLAAYERHQAVLLQVPAPQSAHTPPDLEGARLMIEEALSQRRHRLTTSEAKALLAAFHLPVQHSLNVSSPGDALVAAETLGLPVTLHINSAEEVPDDVVLPSRKVHDAPSVRSAYRDILDEMQQCFPQATESRVGVQRLRDRTGARELQVAIDYDEDFGPVIQLAPLYGSGSSRPAVSLPPLNMFLARDLMDRALQETPTLVQGHKQQERLLDLLMRISEICCELPEVRRLLLRPVVLTEHELSVDDVRISIAPPVTSTRRYGHMAIHPYPQTMSRRWQLPDGRDVTIRPIRPEDAAMEQAFVDGLSPESRYNRFMYRFDKLTPKMLARFTQIDYDREMALAVVLNDREDESRIVAVARYVANPDGQSCEFALTVADDMQRMGLGRQMMQSLMNAARDRGLDIMEGEVLASNRKMLRLCDGLGFRLTRHADDGEVVSVRRHL